MAAVFPQCEIRPACDRSLEIDRFCLRDGAIDRTDWVLAATVITLAHNSRMRVVGAGAETHAQLELLRRFGVVARAVRSGARGLTDVSGRRERKRPPARPDRGYRR